MIFKNAISWFEIPAADIARAQSFYERIFDIKMDRLEFEGAVMCMFPIEDPMTGVGGALCQVSDFHQPSANSGAMIYLNANPDVQTVVDRIEAAGGTIIVPKTEISPEYGYMAVFLDTEGNRIALHSVPEKYL
ncbi:VOC family protein [Mucilaginibacter sp. JRF]|uniref:VOC family protein n=1 Tax=Mucilaginibacter sp. JRF TaxID=2780088 RepID=UPI00187EFE5C|nr:VOC family protein [Mucilaginibacter sp. JRF]MBE9586379.1 VOC family protein [Mucilaginibacter sp. JRF]